MEVEMYRQELSALKAEIPKKESEYLERSKLIAVLPRDQLPPELQAKI